MKFRYKAPYGDGISTFDPGEEIICPLCGDVRPVPPGWLTHNTFITCNNVDHHASSPKYYHPGLFSDINHFIDDDDPQLTAYRISIGELFEEDVQEWLEKRTLWHILSLTGDPKWKVEPDPFWRVKIKRLVKSVRE